MPASRLSRRSLLALAAGTVSSACWTPLCPLGADPPADTQPEIRWVASYAEGLERSQKEQRPLLVYVTMEGCRFCRQMDRQTLTNPQVVKEVRERYLAVKVFRDTDAQLVEQLQIRVFPTTVVISPEAQIVGRIAGFVPEDKFRSQIQRTVRIAATAPRDTRR